MKWTRSGEENTTLVEKIEATAHCASLVNMHLARTPSIESMLTSFPRRLIVSIFFLAKVQYVSVIARVFDFRKLITITDVSLQAMYIACTPIASMRICSQHERLTKYLIPWGVE